MNKSTRTVDLTSLNQLMDKELSEVVGVASPQGENSSTEVHSFSEIALVRVGGLCTTSSGF